MEEDYFVKAGIPQYKTSVPIFGIGEYREDKGEDDFSRKQTWFYVYGDEEIEQEFFTELTDMINSHFVDDQINWDLMTLYPTHSKSEVNPNMKSLVESVSAETGINYRQVLERNKTVRENHELDSERAKVVNLEDSIDVKDFNSKNVILIDNLALSGVSVVHGAHELIKKGAENVFIVVLGISEDFPGKEMKNRKEKASRLLENTKEVEH